MLNVKKNTSVKKRLGKQRVTMAQVAKLAEVSTSTVSHVISGNRTISPQVQQRVRDIIKELNYKPNVAAQSLVNRKTKNIGVIVRDFSGSHTPLYLDILGSMAAQRGYSLTVGASLGNLKTAASYLDSFSNGYADGIIISTPDVSDEQIIANLQENHPIVTPERKVEGFPRCCPADCDFGPVFRKLMEHLYLLGHRKFGFLCGDEKNHKQRSSQVSSFIQDHALCEDSCRVEMDLRTLEQAQAAALKVLSDNPQITALICHNDALAFGAMLAARQMGLDIPGDISITGVDNVPTSLLVSPQLTTIGKPMKEITEAAMEALIDWIEGKSEEKTRQVTPEIILRDSVAAPNHAK